MILPYAKKSFPNLTPEKALAAYIESRNTELEADVQERLYGSKNKVGSGLRRAGYVVLRDFYEGDQWFVSREAGSAMNVTNFVRMTVDNYTSFLTQEEPEIDIPPRDATDDIEILRVREVEKLVKQILDDNEFYNVYYDCSQNMSLLGDGMIAGPFYDSDKKRIWFKNIKRPELVRIIWKTADYDEMLGFYWNFYLSVEEAYNTWRDKFDALGVTVESLVGQQEPRPWGGQQSSEQFAKRVLVQDFWDEEVHLTKVGKYIVDYQEHKQGFIPLLHLKNRPSPTSPWGQSDVEDILDPQKVYNEINSDMQDIIKQVAFASIFGKNLDVQEIQSGVAKIYDLGDEADVFPDPRRTNFPFLQTYLSDKKGDIDVTSGIPDVIQGGKAVQNVSGRALSVLMTPINNRVRGKERRWGIALRKLVANILTLLEKYHPESKALIQGWYNSDIFFPGTLVRDVTEELNKFIQKVQSQYTTMKNIGIASPKDEQELMKKELSDMQIAIEISRSPQMQMMLAQQLIAQAQQAAGEQISRASAKPTLSEGQNQPGENPASAANVPVGTTQSMQGALRAGRGPAMIPNR